VSRPTIVGLTRLATRRKLNLTARDLHVASPFLAAKRDLDHMLARREGDVRRRIAEEFAVNLDFTAARRRGDMDSCRAVAEGMGLRGR